MSKNASQLYLLIDAGPSAEARLSAVLAATRNVAAVLVRAGTVPLDATLARPLVEIAQKANVAALVEGDPALARALRADGVHLPWSTTLGAQFAEAREVLGNRYMIGVEIAANAPDARHQAMEMAEAAADYIAFGPGEAQPDLIAWWAEIFEVPCVAFDVADLGAVAALAADRPEFIAVTLPSGASPADSAAHVAKVVQILDDAALSRAGS
ncbi:MAG: thiamine phosphate synthase [Hyphomicrobiaceae bacterium]